MSMTEVNEPELARTTSQPALDHPTIPTTAHEPKNTGWEFCG